MSPAVLHLHTTAGISVLATSEGANTTNGTSHSITLPSGATAGDVLLVLFRISEDSSSVTTITPPAGWTAEGSHTATRVLSRTHVGGDPSSITITTSASRRSAYTAYRVGGAHGDVDVSSWATLDPPSLTPAWGLAENLWITFVSNRGTSYTHTPPANYTSVLHAATESPPGSTSVYHCAISSVQRILTAASENPGTWAVSSTNQTFVTTVAVRPA